MLVEARIRFPVSGQAGQGRLGRTRVRNRDRACAGAFTFLRALEGREGRLVEPLLWGCPSQRLWSRLPSSLFLQAGE